MLHDDKANHHTKAYLKREGSLALHPSMMRHKFKGFFSVDAKVFDFLGNSWLLAQRKSLLVVYVRDASKIRLENYIQLLLSCQNRALLTALPYVMAFCAFFLLLLKFKEVVVSVAMGTFSNNADNICSSSYFTWFLMNLTPLIVGFIVVTFMTPTTAKSHCSLLL